jgi:hypothetical protein
VLSKLRSGRRCNAAGSVSGRVADRPTAAADAATSVFPIAATNAAGYSLRYQAFLRRMKLPE